MNMEDAGRVSQILQLFPRVIRDGEEASLAASPSYVYFGIILETFGKEKLVAGLWEHLARVLPKHEDQLLMARRLREGLLKASPLVGFPRVSYIVLY